MLGEHGSILADRGKGGQKRAATGRILTRSVSEGFLRVTAPAYGVAGAGAGAGGVTGAKGSSLAGGVAAGAAAGLAAGAAGAVPAPAPVPESGNRPRNGTPMTGAELVALGAAAAGA